MMYSDGHSRLCGNVLYQPLDSSFRWNDDGVSFRLYIIQSTCGLTHSELKRAIILNLRNLRITYHTHSKPAQITKFLPKKTKIDNHSRLK